MKIICFDILNFQRYQLTIGYHFEDMIHESPKGSRYSKHYELVCNHVPGKEVLEILLNSPHVYMERHIPFAKF